MSICLISFVFYYLGSCQWYLTPIHVLFSEFAWTWRQPRSPCPLGQTICKTILRNCETQSSIDRLWPECCPQSLVTGLLPPLPGHEAQEFIEWQGVMTRVHTHAAHHRRHLIIIRGQTQASEHPLPLLLVHHAVLVIVKQLQNMSASNI